VPRHVDEEAAQRILRAQPLDVVFGGKLGFRARPLVPEEFVKARASMSYVLARMYR
jgi:hypothetical protein